jgi:hypothetical protein
MSNECAQFEFNHIIVTKNDFEQGK